MEDWKCFNPVFLYLIFLINYKKNNIFIYFFFIIPTFYKNGNIYNKRSKNMLKLLFFYLFVLFYDKLKLNFQTIIEDVLKIIVFPIKVISWTVWKIRRH